MGQLLQGSTPWAEGTPHCSHPWEVAGDTSSSLGMPELEWDTHWGCSAGTEGPRPVWDWRGTEGTALAQGHRGEQPWGQGGTLLS